jgi:hypothetical protein
VDQALRSAADRNHLANLYKKECCEGQALFLHLAISLSEVFLEEAYALQTVVLFRP